MNMRVVPFALAFLLAPLAAQGSDKLTYEKLEDIYSKGQLCKNPPLAGEEKRLATMLFLSDVLLGVIGGDSYTSDVVGDMSIFQLGRHPDLTLVNLYEYADRKDVSDAIYTDFKKIEESIRPDLDNKILTNKAFSSFKCALYLMLSGRDFEFKEDLERYSQSLNRKVRNRNIENLNRLTRDYQ